MKKKFTVVLLLLAIVLPFLYNLLQMPFDELLAEEEKKMVLDEDYAKAEVSYKEAEEEIDWTVYFTKKESEQEGRLRIAIDTEAEEIGEVTKVTGVGLAVDKDSQQLKTEDKDELVWYFGEEYSKNEENGILRFTTKNTSELRKTGVPLQIAVEPKPDEATQTAAAQNTVSLRSVEAAVLSGSRLGPTSATDPYNYTYPEGEEIFNRRYPTNSTNYFTIGNSDFSLGTYAGEKGSIYKDGVSGDVVNDNDYDEGGANWRNYNYVRDNGAEGNDGGTGRARTTQVWGSPDNRNFTNSYLDYNGAYIKKWVEPITNHLSEGTNAPHDNTTIYNVYLEVIGGYHEEPQPLDVVFVLDKSSSMVEEISSGVTKDAAMIEAVKELSKELLDDSDLDVRIGMVNFRGHPKSGITSEQMAMTRDYNDITSTSKNPALNYTAQTGTDATPLTLGLKKGYELLYKDNGGNDRNPEKILVVIGDGTPTFSYSGFRYHSSPNSTSGNNPGNVDANWTNNNAAINSFWTNDSTTNPLFRDYETGSIASFGTAVRYPTEFDISKRPTGNNYKFGEVTDDTSYDQWFGTGSSDTQAQGATKQNAIHTVAYHHWLKNKYLERDVTNPRVYSVGLGLTSGTSNVAQLDALGRNVLKNIADLKPNAENNESYYYGANNSSQLVDALNDIAGDFIKTISKAVLYDETGEHVSLFGGGEDAEISFYHLDLNQDTRNPDIKYQAPEPWDETKHGRQPEKITATPIWENHSYHFSPISLGEGEMVRIKYQVKLDGGVQNGKFYTVSKEAYIQNEKDMDNEELKMFFPAPSIRYRHPQRNLQIQKKDVNGKPIKGITFALYHEDPDINPDAEILEVQTTDDFGDAIFDHQFDIDGIDSPSHWVKESEGPSWYKLKEDAVKFTILRISKGEDDAIGHYEFVEDDTSGNQIQFDSPGGLWNHAHVGEDFRLSIVQTYNETGQGGVWDELYVNLEMVNEYKPLQLEILKLITGTELPIADVEFSLYPETADGQFGEEAIAKGASDTDGKLQFYKLDSGGNYDPASSELFNIELVKTSGEGAFPPEYEDYTGYKIVETKVPDGTVKPPDDTYWQLRLYKEGKIEYRHSADVDDSGDAVWKMTYLSSDQVAAPDGQNVIKFLLEIENDLVERSVQVMKVDEDGAPLNGVAFNLWRINESGSRGSPYRAYSGITYDDDKKLILTDGTGTFYNHVEGEKYEDQNLDIPLKLLPGDYEIEEVGGLIGYIGSEETFKFTLGVDGRFTDTETGTPITGADGFTFEESTGVLTLTVKNILQELGLELLKIDKLGQSQELEGAAFTISRKTGEETWETAEDLTIDNQNGALHTKNPIELGTYKIIETQAPNKYQRLKGHFELVIAKYEESAVNRANGLPLPGKEKGALYAVVSYFDENEKFVSSYSVELSEKDDHVKLFFEVSNDPINPLPMTGGRGRGIFFIIAACAFLSILLLAILHRHVERKGAKV